MTNIKKAVDILSKNERFNDVSVIGELNWKTIPESYVVDEVYIDNKHRVDILKQDKTIIVNIHNVGLFQVI
jgi:hypothetical protein